MGENLRLVRFYLVLLAIFTVGRWTLGFAGAEYDKTHQIFSIVILTLTSSAYYGYIARNFAGGGVKRALMLGVLLGVCSQIVIFLSTALSYTLGIHSFFNNPRALNVEQAIPFGQAMVARSGSFVANVILNAIAGAIGYGLGAVGPKASELSRA
jgi:hypothetical protein